MEHIRMLGYPYPSVLDTTVEDVRPINECIALSGGRARMTPQRVGEELVQPASNCVCGGSHPWITLEPLGLGQLTYVRDHAP